MILPSGTTVIVADGAKLHVFKNGGDETKLRLVPEPDPVLGPGNKGSGHRHHSSASNHDDRHLAEDAFGVATAEWLNHGVLSGTIEHVYVVAPPAALGELRRHYHKSVEAKLVGELHKDLTGHTMADIEAAIAKA